MSRRPICSIYVIDLKFQSTVLNHRLVGRCVLDCIPDNNSSSSSSRGSREQQLLSERQRSSTCGLITSYQLHPTTPTIIFPMSDGLYILNNIEVCIKIVDYIFIFRKIIHNFYFLRV